MNKLKQLEVCGQSLWLDDLKRDLIEKGELRTLIKCDGVKGITSNPSTFERAIGETDEYANAVKEFQTQSDHSISAIYEHLAVADIRAAADVLRPVYDQTQRRDGYVSLECSPYLANDTEATVAEALRLRSAVTRPNLMIKVPATPAGIPAIRQLTGRGVNVNVTLLFSIDVYQQVVDAYISGLEDLARGGGNVSKVASVASLFVSRIDAAIDRRLDQLSDKRAANLLRGEIGIANAKLAYARYKVLFSTPRWQMLVASGAKTQRLLWASTGAKDSTYRDTRYIEALIGRDTIVTVPPATMDAFREHGEATSDAIEQDVEGARTMLATLEQHGVSLSEVTEELVEGGVQQFADAFDKLFGTLARRRHTLLEGDYASLEIGWGSAKMKVAFDAEMEVWRREGRIRRLWAGDKSLWPGEVKSKCASWLHISESELAGIERLHALAKEVRQRGFSDVVLLAMAGPSLGPEVLVETLARQSGGLCFPMLGNTDLARNKTIGRAVDSAKTLFIVVSSTSGSTLALNIFTEYFFGRGGPARGKEDVGEHFIAATDADSWLERRTKQLRVAHFLQGGSSIDGGYAVRSKLALVAAAAIGLDVKRLLETTRQLERTCGPDVPPAENPGVQLGVVMGIAASRFGRDKVTIIASPEVAPLGAWLEQLLAESTDRHGRGLIPVAGEAMMTPERCGNDRLFVFLGPGGQGNPQRQAVEALEREGHPVVRVNVKDIWHIGQEFFRWEIATAVACAILGIDPAGQPDVEASKDSLVH
jgi:transaldolase/glucose-6-phosphate isomerase